MRLFAAPLLILVGASVLGMGPAAAARLPTIIIDPAYGPPLTTVKVTGRSFCTTCGAVTLSVASLNVDTAAVRADGSFSRVIRIPGSTRPGDVPIEASQGASTTTARTTFSVTVDQPAPTTYPAPKSVPPPGNLPRGGKTGTHIPSSATPRSTPASAPRSTPATSARPAPTSSANTGAPNSPTATSAADSRSSDGDTAWPIAVVLVAAALLAAGGAAWWLRRRRPAGGEH